MDKTGGLTTELWRKKVRNPTAAAAAAAAAAKSLSRV